MSDTIYYNHIDKNGMYSLYEHPINPKTQAEADAIYQDLDGYMTDEAIFQDGEASLTEAIQTFTFYLQKAKRVKALGFLPTETIIGTGGGRLSPQLPLSRPNRTDARWTVQKRIRPTFGRLSPQLLCLYDCPSLLFARTSRSLDLHSRIYADLRIYAQNLQSSKPS